MSEATKKSPDHDAIGALIGNWMRETRAGNIDAVLALMAPDAMFLVPGQPPMQGRDAFAAGLRTVLSHSAIDAVSEIEEIEIAGDMAYCRTRLTVTITSKHGELPLERRGHTLTILRKGEDGRWLLTRDANLLAPAG